MFEPMPRRVLAKNGKCCGSGCMKCPYLPQHTKGSTKLRDEMNELDLHGVKHEDVHRIVDRHIYLNTPPFKIITGNSSRMKELVEEVLDEYNYKSMGWESGSIIVKGLS